MDQQGWISLYRKIRGHWLFEEKRKFSKFEAWIDLLLEVNHKEAKFLFDGKLVELEAGQTITSIRKLCDRWGWSNSKVTQFLKLLQSEGMVTVKSDTKKTVITIDKYRFYQDRDIEKTTLNRQTNDTQQTLKHTNNNVNNDNNKNNDNKIKDSRPKRVYDPDSPYMKLAIYFLEQIRLNNESFKQPNLQTWADDIRKIVEIDKRTEEQVSYLMKFVQQDDFEQSNVLSPSKLRKRFDQLVMKAKKQHGNKNQYKNVVSIYQQGEESKKRQQAAADSVTPETLKYIEEMEKELPY